MKRLKLHQLDTAGAVNGDLLAYNAATDEVEYATPVAGGITYAQNNKTRSVTRNSSSAGSFSAQTWLIAHHHYLNFESFVADIFQADTYTLAIDGNPVASTVCAAASVNQTFTPGIFAGVGAATPVVLAPGPHMISLTGTAVRRFYYRSDGTTGGTYTKVAWGAWQESLGNYVPGLINFDAEGT